ncbi:MULTISPECIES: aconitate hydratase AcnA [unclassified Lactococcus]|uniref:aconitate hydratase AcnA n=1 Tax=unclassified Lactococcus TaxID=2643510 RepID=UPI0011CB9F9D|nr:MULTISPECIES: aconitate hydratase AcnA [unclassified Lactococcus]MQW23379.1 aconitate hydratase AcnA [Lactococcus sp. dk101]TXK37920.1 aconitate hydratase AcnA [Lactococcus sp. dk310]TXK49574.1 aconitate hydratase AcnA [Lactococcus sp. dk322]
MKKLTVLNRTYDYCDISDFPDIEKYPYSLRMLLESVLRQENGLSITKEHAKVIQTYLEGKTGAETVFLPSRVVLQDFTGVPAIVDLAAMRDAMVKLGKNPSLINPEIPVDLVIDHSVQVDEQASEWAILKNSQKEFERNHERYAFLKWAEKSFDNFRVVPPATGIIHQVNIEYLSHLVQEKEGLIYPDSVFGTDSHTTMINGLGVLGWGVGGIEAEAVMLGEPSAIPLPEVIGVNLTGELGPFATATDLALTVTKVLRDAKVVGKFVEFFGKGLGNLSVADRTTIANMAPEYGATCGYFPIDEKTLDYLRNTNRKEEELLLIEAYMKANCLFYDDKTEPQYSRVIEIDLTTITSRMSGPSRPQDMVELADLSQNFEAFVTQQRPLKKEDGRVAIAAITSCTNTSNPYVMMMAGLLAKNAVERGLSVPSYVKTSLAPGSKVVTAYLEASGLLPYLEKLGFHVVGYGCTTCIGNSGPLLPEMEEAVSADDLIVASVLSGNRNFEGRIHPLVKANYLASPPLVVAYALAGNVRRNLTTTSLGIDNDGQDVFLSELMPTALEVEVLVKKYVTRDLYAENYAKIFDENEAWNAIETSQSEVYAWNENSTYISNPPYFETLEESLPETGQLSGLRVLGKFGDSITTDHISPAGNIPLQSPAGKYLSAAGLAYKDFNSYGSRRGNDKVMTRGTFANVRIKNQLALGQEGGYSQYNGQVLPVYDVAEAYKQEHTGLIILAGKDYGMGSSRDWAAKGTKLLGVKAVIADSFERIHRSNLVMMGVLPLQYLDGQNAETLGLTGYESFNIDLPKKPQILEEITVQADDKVFQVLLRFDSQSDLQYYANDGIMPYVIRNKKE